MRLLCANSPLPFVRRFDKVRAAREGECRDAWNIFDGFFRRRTVKASATSATNNMFPKQGSLAVERVFERCYNDLEPLSKRSGGLEQPDP